RQNRVGAPAHVAARPYCPAARRGTGARGAPCWPAMTDGDVIPHPLGRARARRPAARRRSHHRRHGS
ncbi:MAG TPA: hypothetical protein VFI47_28800, partial [Acidimicrobiales bacterium]|nr:hypothetical protein [Acidimicrobiales bacterium]